MKSLVEEASSVVKAIEKAWNRAGCPQTFSVKVFETPETNFFGFTKKSAKVGIFFEEEPTPQQKKYVPQNRDQRSQGTNRPQPKGRTDASSYSREREEKEDDIQVDSRRAHHNGRQPNQGQRSYERTSEPRQTPAPVQKEAVVQRPEPVQHEDRQDRQPSRERQQRPTGGRPPRTNDRNDRERDEKPRQARTDAPVIEQEQRREPRQEPRRDYEPRHEQEPRHEREYEPRRDREQDAREPRGDYEDKRREGGSRDRNSRSGDRRSSSRGGDRDRGGRTSRPERAQRHEFEEERPMFNNGSSEQTQPAQEQHQTPVHSAPEMAPSLAPQKKVLKVSGRRYSAPVKKTDE